MIDFKRYSDFLKLLRVTALVYRFTVDLKKKITKKSLTLSKYVKPKEMRLAKLLWLNNQYYLMEAKDLRALNVI